MRGVNVRHTKRRFQLVIERPKVHFFFSTSSSFVGFYWPLNEVHLLIAMLYEFAIAVGSILFSFSLYFGFYKYFQSASDDVVFDRRDDLDGKELLLVNVVSDVKYTITENLYARCSTSPAGVQKVIN